MGGDGTATLNSMGSIDAVMTLSEQYAAWLRDACRRAGIDVDSQRGGGRTLLADATGVAPSTVGRWLSGKSTPDPDKFELIAKAVGVPVIEMLVGAGIISVESVAEYRSSDVRSRPVSPTQTADDAGITDPIERQMFIAWLEARARRDSTNPGQDNTGGVANEG